MKHLIYIGPAGAEYWRQDRGGWQRLAQAPQGPVWAVTDLAEESFSEIQIPRIFGRDRANFLERQMAARFPDTRYRTVLPARGANSLMERLAPPRQMVVAVDAADRIDAALGVGDAPLVGLWSSSMLLATLAGRARMPADLFVVLPGDGVLRIVFLKNHQPVLARLAPSGTQATEQAAEIARTLRHLENTRVVERSERRYPVLMLGHAPDMDAALAAHRLDAVASRAPWAKRAPADWRFPLFDLALTSPPGQLAPARLRASYLAQRLGRFAYGTGALCLGAAVWATSGHTLSAMQARQAQAQTRQQLQQVGDELARTEQAIARYGVAPDLVRQTVALDRQEVAQAPELNDALYPMATLVGRNPGHRVARLDWRVLTGAEAACVKTPAQGGDPQAADSVPPAPTANDTGNPAHKVELQLEIQLAEGTGPRERARVLSELSLGLSRAPGVSVLRDPAKVLAHAALSSAQQTGTAQNFTWCMSLAKPVTTATPASGVAP